MRARREGRYNVDIWPGFVDALSTLILSIIFLLVVFILGQFFLSQLLQGRNQAVVRLEGRVTDLSSQLALEQDAATELRRTLARINADLQQAFLDRDELLADLNESEAERGQLSDRLSVLTTEQAALQRTLEEMRLETTRAQAQAVETERLLAEARQTITADKEQIELQLGQLVQLRRDIEALQQVRAELEGRVAEQTAALDLNETQRQQLLQELGSARDRASALETELASAEERTMLAQRELSGRDLRIEELTRASAELESRLADESSARGTATQQVETLVAQIRTLSEQLAALDAALQLKQGEIDAQSETIASLGQRLNVALASKVEELSQYRSDFFGRLRTALGEREDIRVVGDRFVLQSEVLFPSGSADLAPGGRDELTKLAETIKSIAQGIPEDLPWVLQVDGHTDRIPINTPRFPSNWELSTARAISVAQFLIEAGLPADRVAARGFAEFQPIDPGDSPEALRRNRRIEFKLTTR